MKLRMSPAPTPRKRHKVQLSDSTSPVLDRIGAWYAARLGGPVSNSLIIRRALVGLLDHLDRLEGAGMIATELGMIRTHRD